MPWEIHITCGGGLRVSVTVNLPLVVAVFCSVILVYCLFRFFKSSKIAIATAAGLVTVLACGIILSDKTYCDRVPSAERQLLDFAEDMKAMGVTRIAWHANPLIATTYTSLSARRSGKYFNEVHIDGSMPSAQYPKPQTAIEYYSAFLPHFAMTLFAPFMDFDKHEIAEVKLVDGSIVVKARRDVLKALGADMLGTKLSSVAQFHLSRLAKAQAFNFQAGGTHLIAKRAEKHRSLPH
jgi:hypothetical protein